MNRPFRMLSIEPNSLENPPTYPKNGTYADLLVWHLFVWRTRCGGSTSVRGTDPWDIEDFKEKIMGKAYSANDHEKQRHNYENWIGNGQHVRPNPGAHNNIVKALFGGEPQFEIWKNNLEAAIARSTPKGKNTCNISVDRSIEILAANGYIDQVTLRRQPANIKVPKPTPYFLGRKNVIDEVLSEINAAPEGLAVLIHGGPGIGKTELTKAIAHHKTIAQRFGQRRWFIPLETATTAEAMRDAIMRELGCDPAQDFQCALANLQGKRALLILDNLESPWDPIAEREATTDTIRDLCEQEGLTIIASFRGSEPVGGALWAEHKLEELSHSDATKLFASISGQRVLNDPNFYNFLNALGGLPLAIELVARRAHDRVALEPLWQEWKKAGSAFVRQPNLAEARLTSLSCSVEFSLRSERITPSAFKLFSILGNLPDGIAAKDRDALIGQSAFDAEECLLHAGLAIEVEDRVTLLPPIREHARLYESEDIWHVHFLGRLSHYRYLEAGAESENNFHLILKNIGNVISSIDYVISKGKKCDVIIALETLSTYFAICGPLIYPTLEKFAEICEDQGDFVNAAGLYFNLGSAAYRRFDDAVARSALDKAINLFRRAGDTLKYRQCSEIIDQLRERSKT